jgi:hypothetical protein
MEGIKIYDTVPYSRAHSLMIKDSVINVVETLGKNIMVLREMSQERCQEEAMPEMIL